MTEKKECPSCGMNYIDDENMEGYVDQHVCKENTAASRDDLLDTHCRECGEDEDGCNITTRFGWLCPNCVDNHFAASAKAYDTVLAALHEAEAQLAAIRSRDDSGRVERVAKELREHKFKPSIIHGDEWCAVCGIPRDRHTDRDGE